MIFGGYVHDLDGQQILVHKGAGIINESSFGLCVYNCIVTYTPFPLFRVVSLFPITPVTDPCRNTRNPANQIIAYRSARTNRTPAC
jgi:hypothetical protein